MKKLSLFLVAIFCVFMMNAQTFVLSYEGEEFDNNLNITLEQSAGVILPFIHIENTSDVDATIKLTMSRQYTNSNNEALMCVAGNCLTDTVSPVFTIAAGDVYSQFDIQYTYEDASPTYIVFNIIDAVTEQLYKTFSVSFAGTSAINNVRTNKDVVLSLAANPNPAQNSTVLRYSVPSKYNNAKVVVRNTFGSVVKQSAIKTGVAGKVTFNTCDLTNGVYFYSIVANGSTLVTKKLIVKH